MKNGLCEVSIFHQAITSNNVYNYMYSSDTYTDTCNQCFGQSTHQCNGCKEVLAIFSHTCTTVPGGVSWIAPLYPTCRASILPLGHCCDLTSMCINYTTGLMLPCSKLIIKNITDILEVSYSNFERNPDQMINHFRAFTVEDSWPK